MVRFALISFMLCLVGAEALFSETSVRRWAQQQGASLVRPEGGEGISVSFHGRTILIDVKQQLFIYDFRRAAKFPGQISQRSGHIYLSGSAEQSFLSFFPPAPPVVSTIILDPGHGGDDYGAYRPYKEEGQTYYLREKNIVLDIGLNLYGRLKSKYGDKKQIYLTRDSDRFVTLRGRTDFANKHEGGEKKITIFIAIHANASPSGNASGFEVWYLPVHFERNVFTKKDLTQGSLDVVPLLNKFWETEYSRESSDLAHRVLRGLYGTLVPLSHSRGVKQFQWHVVREAHMASVLVEVGFVSDPKEQELLRSPAYLDKIALGIFNGTVSFVKHWEN